MGKSMSRYLVERVMAAENVELLPNTEVRDVRGEDRLDGIVVQDNRSGARRTLAARVLFVFIGAEANTGWLTWTVELDERDFILTGSTLERRALDENLWRGFSREPYLLETSVPGVFAAGDARGFDQAGRLGSGDGSMAVRWVHQ